MLINLYNQLIIMSVVAGGLYLILKLFSGLTMKCFTPSWYYYTYIGIYMFLLLPYHKFLSLFHLDFNQNAGNGLVLPTLPSTLELSSPGSNDLVAVADKTENVLTFNFDFLPYLLLAGTLAFIVVIMIQNIKLYRRIFSVCRLADEAQFQGILSRCKQKMGISKEVLVYTSPYASTPFLYGVLKPRIVLPDIEFTTEELQHVFYHELTHWKRHDPWLKFLMLLVNAVHWFNPLAYIARYDIDRFCELSCDESVVTSMNTEERRRYCELMLNVLWHATGHNAKLISAFSDKRKQIERRITFMLNCKKMKTSSKILSVVVAVIIMAFGATIVAFANDSSLVEGNPQLVIPAPPTDKSDLPTEIVQPFKADRIEGGAIDEEGTPDVIMPLNISFQETRTLSKGGSKTYSFDVNGGWFDPDHNAVSVVITLESGEKYQYISEDVTNGVTLANVTAYGDSNRTLSNLDPDSEYEITIINLGTSDLKYTISLTSYID